MRHLVICCDGTWNRADQSKDGVPTPTNVRLFHNLLANDAWGFYGNNRGARSSPSGGPSERSTGRPGRSPPRVRANEGNE